MKRFSPLLFILLFAFAECQTPVPAEQEPELPGRRELIRTARRGANWLWVYAAADSIKARMYRELLAPVVAAPPFEQKISLRSVEEVSAEDLARHPIFLMGSHFPESWLEKISMPASLQVGEQAFSFADENFAGQKDLLQLFYHPNPWNPAWPMHLMVVNEDTYLLDYFAHEYQDDWSELFWSSWGYTVLQNGYTRFLGYFADSTWALDRNVHFAFSPSADTLRRSPEANWIAHDVSIPDSLLDRLDRQHLVRRDRLTQFLGEGPLPQLSFHFYPTVEHKGLSRQNMESAEAEFDEREIHLVVNSFFQGDQAGEDMRVLLRDRLGKPAALTLETGLAMQFAVGWGQQKGYDYWASRIYRADHLFPVAELLDDELMATVSPYLLAPSAGVFVDFLLDRYGKSAFLETYVDWRPSADSIAVLEAAWQQYADQRYQQVALEPVKKTEDNFLRGYTFAHEGYRVYNGFGSQAARNSLEALQNLGTDAVSIVPYSFMSDPRVPTAIPIVKRAGTENDPATLFAHFSAKEMGMYSLLKPQIWVRGSWPGAIDFATEEEWAQFFIYYDRWMTHYVMMAEMYGFDAIAVGTELAQSTIKHPKKWQEMLGRWRRLYRGTITYAANWGEEIEKLAFWPELDVVGCNCYYPLADSTEADLATLTTGANVMLDKVSLIAKQAQRPIWLTEIGYRSVVAPWRNPHAEANGRPYNGEHQALAYEALFQAVDQHPNVKGIFWWKWPSYLEYSRRSETGFTPLGKPAEKVVSKWYRL